MDYENIHLIFYALPLVLVIPIIISAIFMISGRGSFLLFMSKKDKEKYDSKTLATFVGKILLALSLSLFGIPFIFYLSHQGFLLERYVDIIILGHIGLIIGICIVGRIYTNTSKRFRN